MANLTECAFNGIIPAECGCPEHFSRVGDFSTDSTQPCDINTLPLRILWSIQVAFWTVFLCGSVGTIVLIQCKSRYLGPKFNGERTMMSLKSFTAVSFIVVGCLRASSPSQNLIGGEPVTTWLFCWGAFTFWVDLLLFFTIQTSPHLISLAVARSKRLYFIYNKVYPSLLCVAGVGVFAPLALLYGNKSEVAIFTQLHFIALGVLMFALILTFLVAMELILKEIRFAMASHDSSRKPENTVSGSGGANGDTASAQATINNRKRSIVRHKLAQIESQVVQFRRDGIVHVITGPISIAIGASPFLIRYCSYYLPVIWAMASLGAIRYTAFSFSTIRAASNKSTSSKGSILDSADGPGESDEAMPMGLGIVSKSKKRKPKWSLKMSRITEQSESRVVSIDQTISS